MEILITITYFLIIGLTIILPILVMLQLRKNYGINGKWIYFILISLLLLGFLISTFAWWIDKSNMILLSHYGYDFDAITDLDRLKNVGQENIENVKRIETSIMGIGWPLKAIFGFTILTPYPFLLYFGSILIDKMKRIK